ncbi:MAG: hypothetical protein H6908_04765 [Hyphomicrobiales bacterium]|nr:hypothetical protein [Hyphomicrobiales bacterium]
MKHVSSQKSGSLEKLATESLRGSQPERGGGVGLEHVAIPPSATWWKRCPMCGRRYALAPAAVATPEARLSGFRFI